MNILPKKISDILKKNKITNLTPIQEISLPILFKKKDTIIISRTGSGKTLTFLIPIINKFLKKNKDKAVIIAPTKDLCVQIYQNIQIFNPLGIKCSLIIDGKNELSDEHLIVGTPGSLRNIIKSIKKINFLVLDEVDKLFCKNYEKDIKYIFKYFKIQQVVDKNDGVDKNIHKVDKVVENKMNGVVENLENIDKVENNSDIVNNSDNLENIENKVKNLNFQIILSTATFQESLISQYFDLNQFKICQIDKKNLKISEYYALIPFKQKILYFYKIISSMSKCIIFVSRIYNTYLISNFLNLLNLNSCFINGQILQKEKNEIIKKFKNNEFNILVSTDILSRGIDIPSVKNIINYDLPKCPSEYVHRIGRTARKNEGNSITLITQYDIEMLQRIEKFTGRKLESFQVDENGIEKDEERIFDAFERAVRKSKLEIKVDEQKIKNKKINMKKIKLEKLKK